MNDSWQSQLKYDPLPVLLASGHAAIVFQAKKYLLDDQTGSVETLWQLPAAKKILKRQQPTGYWKYPGANQKERAAEDYSQLETYRQLGYLVEKYLFNRSHPSIVNAAEFLFSRQTDEGDFRGIYGSQYTANYTAGILELLVKAGYADHPRTLRCFSWLEKVRQADGGWCIPIRSHQRKFDWSIMTEETLPFMPDAPSSHLVTGVVLRAYAAHPEFHRSPTAQNEAAWLAERLLTRDTYHDRQPVETWFRITFPFWFTDLVSALDSLSRIGLPPDHPKIQQSLHWLQDQQKPDGSWQLYMLRSGGEKNIYDWLTLTICKIYKRFYG